MTFENWEKAVDNWLYKLYGVTLDFLPDWNSYDAWKEGMTPKEAAKKWYNHAQDF